MKKRTPVRAIANHTKRKGRKLWAFGYTEIAAFLEVTEVALRQAVFEGHVDPASLESLHAAKLRGERALYSTEPRKPRTPKAPVKE